jgi:hypothetical protein
MLITSGLKRRDAMENSLTFLVIKGVAYPRGEKPFGCPAAGRTNALKIFLTPQQLKNPPRGELQLALAGRPCWIDCRLRCPIKDYLLRAVPELKGLKKSSEPNTFFFIEAEGLIYPRDERPPSCSKLRVKNQTRKISRTPDQLRQALKRGDSCLGLDKPLCWTVCKLTCPARDRLFKAVPELKDT